MQDLKRAILVNIIPHGSNKEEELKNFDELTHLVTTYGGVVILKIVQKRGRPSAKTFLGKGKTQEVLESANKLNANLIVINDFLKPKQANNLRKIFNIDIWDRFELILKIFDKHAKNQIAKLQIELARLKYEFPKLLGIGVSLAQQAGHIGIRSGAGEKLLEVKRRHLRNQINTIDNKLKNLRKVHQGQRDRRKRIGYKLAALVGYTNSGKSTLFKALTKKDVYIADKLFATLSTTIGELSIFHKNHEKILISDTIGFIKDLPPLLFSSFLATLEEIQNADLILHVIDSSDPKIEDKIQIVQKILKQLNCDAKPTLFIFNKTDLLNKKNNQKRIEKQFKNRNTCFISAINKQDIETLKEKIQTYVD